MKRILIANRGEIACRIAATAHALGYETVAVFSDADRGARHVRVCDVAVHIGPSEASKSYLHIDALIAAAKKTGADAIHPGYGFLAENAGFAERCEHEGLTFIGPTPEAIRLMGSKRQAKLRMEAAGVPVVPGYSGDAQDPEALMAAAEQVGLPLMIKASAGGGGRGLRLVTQPEGLAPAIVAARSEAISGFGDGELILERAVISPRHVEIQVFADTHGNVLHLGERDCSVQRRHQKVVEEAPSPAVDEALRARMGEAAVAAARAIGYRGAGTVEMLLDAEGHFYFMEMNTRLQVEHPVTELVTGQDLVAWQLDVAEGRPLPMTQDELRIEGHAIEVRLYAEDAYSGFLPQVGVANEIVWPEGVRVDHGLDEGQAVTAFYDAMVAKLVAHGRDRGEARRRLVRALRETHVAGLVTNQPYLLEILEHPEMVAGRATTDFLETHLADSAPAAPGPVEWAAAAVLALRGSGADHWRSTGSTGSMVNLSCGDVEAAIVVEPEGAGYGVRAVAAGAPAGSRAVGEPPAGHPLAAGPIALGLTHVEPGKIEVEADGVVRRLFARAEGPSLELGVAGSHHRFTRRPVSSAGAEVTSADELRAPMAGRIVEVRAEVGQAVAKGALLVVLEAMKMQMELVAERAGEVASVEVAAGDQVDSGQRLVALAEQGES